jgi:hypothetical protein
MVEAAALRHPELVSGSIYQDSPALAARWMLKQVQHDELVNGTANSNLLRASASPREPVKSNLTRRRGDAESIYV